VSVPLREVSTGRLLLRQWREADLEPFAELNADPEVMRYFPARLTREQSDNLARAITAYIDDRGWGLWAIEVVGGPGFIGFTGLNEPNFDARFMPAVEVGWRLAREPSPRTGSTITAATDSAATTRRNVWSSSCSTSSWLIGTRPASRELAGPPYGMR
jgi:RimJ/RimL family protein N-acetyltransferase